MVNNQVGGLWPFTKTPNTGYGYGTTGYGTTGYITSGYSTTQSSFAGISSGVLQYLFYFIILVIVAIVLLVIINYTLYPIFKVRAGGKGFIPIPGTNDENLYWTNPDKISIIPDTDLSSQTENWSMMLDIQVDNPTANTDFPRVLFTRGSIPPTIPPTYTENDTILKMNPSFNTIMYLDRLTNDLYISVQTTSNDVDSTPMLESAVIPNIPVGQSIRIGLMIGSHSFEVYINGYLAKTKSFSSSVSPIVGSFQPPNSSIMTSTARVLNLRVWKRILTASEFREYGTSTATFPEISIPDSCLTNPEIPGNLSGVVNYLGDLMETGQEGKESRAKLGQDIESSITKAGDYINNLIR
jgi:hypothetical protein